MQSEKANKKRSPLNVSKELMYILYF